MLTAFSSSGQFWRGNLHCHTTESDGKVTPEEACRRYQEAGYDFLVVTDHYRDKFDYPITDTSPFRNESFSTLIGTELHTQHPEQATLSGTDWHILAVGVPFDFEAPSIKESISSLTQRCLDTGAFVALAHPHYNQLTVDEAMNLPDIHAVEVYNHTSQLAVDRGDGLVMFDELLNRGRKINGIAVDDTHWKINDFAGGWVMVKAQSNTPEQLLSALKSGDYYSSQGPEIHDIRIENGALVVESSEARSIVAVGKGNLNSKKHGDGLIKASLSINKFRGSWCRVVVTDAQGKRAWSNPLWLGDDV